MGIAQAALRDAGFDTVCSESQTCCQRSRHQTKDTAVATASFDVPEIDNREVLGEWLIPRGDALLVSFGAFTVADKDGKAIVKERLALIEAVDAHHPHPGSVRPKGRDAVSSTPIPPPVPLGTSSVLPNIQELPKIALPTPVMPSRSIPQGVHADGTPARIAAAPR